MVRRRHMGVGSDHETGAAVAEEADALLFARRLAVEIDHDGIGGLAQRTGFEFAVEDGERIVERRHEDAAQRVDDQRALAVLGIHQCGAAALACPSDSSPGRIRRGARSMNTSASR